MSVEQMRKQLLSINPKWKKETVNNWSTGQVIAIYNKEIKKIKTNNNLSKQLSFF